MCACLLLFLIIRCCPTLLLCTWLTAIRPRYRTVNRDLEIGAPIQTFRKPNETAIIQTQITHTHPLQSVMQNDQRPASPEIQILGPTTNPIPKPPLTRLLLPPVPEGGREEREE